MKKSPVLKLESKCYLIYLWLQGLRWYRLAWRGCAEHKAPCEKEKKAIGDSSTGRMFQSPKFFRYFN
jgi:hypothetical protein